jgi:hypothetical protein
MVDFVEDNLRKMVDSKLKVLSSFRSLIGNGLEPLKRIRRIKVYFRRAGLHSGNSRTIRINSQFDSGLLGDEGHILHKNLGKLLVGR